MATEDKKTTAASKKTFEALKTQNVGSHPDGKPKIKAIKGKKLELTKAEEIIARKHNIIK